MHACFNCKDFGTASEQFRIKSENLSCLYTRATKEKRQKLSVKRKLEQNRKKNYGKQHK